MSTVAEIAEDDARMLLKIMLMGNDFDLTGLFNAQMYIPQYNPVSLGDWELKYQSDLPKSGYFNGPRIMGREIPVLRKDGTIWMSVLPMECESHLPHTCRSGDMLVYGLGLGYVIYNMYYNHRSHSITVVERDQEVIDLFYKAIEGIEAWEWVMDEVEIICADAFYVDLPKVHYDHVYVDIWEHMFPKRAVSDVQKICKRLHSFDTVSWWTMEADVIEWARRSSIKPDELNGSSWLAMGDDNNLPVQFWDGFDYDTYIEWSMEALLNQVIK